MKQATIDAFTNYIKERLGEYPSDYMLQNVGNALITALGNETPDSSTPAQPAPKPPIIGINL